MTIRVLNKRKDQIPFGSFYVGRPTPLGNPWRAKKDDSDRTEVIERYRHWLNLQWRCGNEAVKTQLHAMADHLRTHGSLDIVCWCSPKSCHADVIAQAVQNIVDKDL